MLAMHVYYQFNVLNPISTPKLFQVCYTVDSYGGLVANISTLPILCDHLLI